MHKLFLDIGNTRVKRALVNKAGIEVLPAFTLETELADDNLSNALFDDVGEIDEVYITSVTSPEKLELIKSAIHEELELFPVLFEAQRSACGLVTGYDNFHQLGADRWMAMQGAIKDCLEPLIVVSAGTAMTIDAVMDGKHLGGFIVPGLTSLRKALAMDTAALNEATSEHLPIQLNPEDGGMLATNTESAILGGTLYMTAAFINAVIADLNMQMNTKFKVFMTGGNATVLAGLLDESAEVVSDLVLQGMIKVQESVKKY